MKKKKLNLGPVSLNILKTLVLAILMVLFNSNYVLAQCDPDDPGTPNGCDLTDIDDVPIDGGASLLVAAGVAYGLKKVYDKRKQNKEADVA